MKRRYSLLLALPTTNALSLANFQSISLTEIPLLCQITYDGQIPSCQVSDFKTGCTAACLLGLDVIATEVIEACDGTHVTSTSLLGIIQGGGIREALCPTLAKTTTTKAETTAAAKTTSSAVGSVTIPTDSVGVTGGLGSQTTTAKTVKTTSAASTPSPSTSPTPTPSVPGPVSQTSTSTSETTESTSTPISSESSELSSTESATTEASPTTITTTIPGNTIETSSSSTSSSAKAAATKANSNSNTDDSGGGSPFDIQSGASRRNGNIMLGILALAAWAGLMAVR